MKFKRIKNPNKIVSKKENNNEIVFIIFGSVQNYVSAFKL